MYYLSQPIKFQDFYQRQDNIAYPAYDRNLEIWLRQMLYA